MNACNKGTYYSAPTCAPADTPSSQPTLTPIHTLTHKPHSNLPCNTSPCQPPYQPPLTYNFPSAHLPCTSLLERLLWWETASSVATPVPPPLVAVPAELWG